MTYKMTETDILNSGKPADFSFRHLRTINVTKFFESNVCIYNFSLMSNFYFLLAIGFEGARYTRVAGVPERGDKKKFLTRSIWMNNNKLRSIKNMDKLANSVLEYPEQLSWIDFSFNYITEIDEVG